MKLCNEVITVFNSYVDQSTKLRVYKPTIIHGVSWFAQEIVSVTDNGLVSANKFTIRIPAEADTGNKTYLSPHDYANTQIDSISDYWTLVDGDIIVKGEVEETGLDAKLAKLQENYDAVVIITSVTDNRRVINAPHWKVVAK